MRSFSEKCDNVLYFLKDNGACSWTALFMATGLKINDAILLYLKDRECFIHYDNDEIILTAEGYAFISQTSFSEGIFK